jgi:hypothetical protein
MKFALSYTISLLSLFCCDAALAQTESIKSRPEPTIRGVDDIAALVQHLSGPADKKSEFETTAEFEARRKQLLQENSRSFTFVIGIWDGDLAYDADSGLMLVMPHLHYDYFNFNRTLTLWAQTITTRQYAADGSNALGISRRIAVGERSEYGVAVAEASPLFRFLDDKDKFNLLVSQLPKRRWSFPIEVSAARLLKPFIRIAITGTVDGLDVYKESLHTSATMTSPVEDTLNKYYVGMSINELRVLDSRTGDTIAKFDQPPTAQ